ncbi:MAG: methylornithine synthase PylB [Gemmatimonadota bacterium]
MQSILDRAEEGDPLSEADVQRLLSIVQEEERDALLAAARRVRAAHTADRVFLYGFLYLSTFCRNDCHFCFYRRSNRAPPRYRKTPEQIVEAAGILAESGVHLIDLTMGEDPAYFDGGDFEELAHMVASVAEATGLPVMVSPGMVNQETLFLLKNSGASWYACYQETHDRSLFEEIRPGQDFHRRLEGKRTARRLGLLTEEGMLSGLGESSTDVVRTLTAMRELETDQVRVMSFVPQPGTPLAGRPQPDPDQEVKIIAILRLLFPDRLIPASLDVFGLAGLRDRLDAGANVITSLVPPGQGFAGVAQSTLDIDDARRTVASVEPVIRECGLTAATGTEYRRWVEDRMERIRGT